MLIWYSGHVALHLSKRRVLQICLSAPSKCICAPQQDEDPKDTKPLTVKEEEPDGAEPKQEPMETKEEKKPEIKKEPKEEEEEGRANGTAASTSPTQNRKKSEDLVLCKTSRGQEFIQ